MKSLKGPKPPPRWTTLNGDNTRNRMSDEMSDGSYRPMLRSLSVGSVESIES